jgi:hypothetical protein
MDGAPESSMYDAEPELTLIKGFTASAAAVFDKALMPDVKQFAHRNCVSGFSQESSEECATVTAETPDVNYAKWPATTIAITAATEPSPISRHKPSPRHDVKVGWLSTILRR